MLTSILRIMEEKLAQMETNVNLRKKVFNVMLECMQNLYHHSIENDGLDAFEKDQRGGLIMAAKNDDGYSVMTGNFVENENAGDLRERLEEVNSLSRGELKELYRFLLAEGGLSSKGGAGLGIVDIARKSGKKLEFGFIPFDKTSQFFSLNVKVK